MDYKKKIEIPFGAFDSELEHQEINIPNGFKAVIDGNKIILTKIESEDEKVRKALIEMVHDTTCDSFWADYNVHKEEVLAWLEKQDPKKHEEELEKAYKTADKVQYRRGYEAATKEMEKQGEQKPAWSEEDEERLSDAIFFVREYQIPTRDKRLLNAAKETEDWLKSLKTRCTWKPSDEQMELLKDASARYEGLQSLYNDLNKLKGE